MVIRDAIAAVTILFVIGLAISAMLRRAGRKAKLQFVGGR
jgi:hypothetical protein